jgi:hypothetical protein
VIDEYKGIRYKFERRRYGSGPSTRFFTWLMYRTPNTGPEWESYGDPWPKVRLNKKELQAALDDIISRN